MIENIQNYLNYPLQETYQDVVLFESQLECYLYMIKMVPPEIQPGDMAKAEAFAKEWWR